MNLNEVYLVSVSVVSHGQLDMVADLLADLEKYCLSSHFEVVLTINTKELKQINVEFYSFPIKIINNDQPKGFGANHNQAFKASSGTFFCVLNPDVRMVVNPFPALIKILENSKVGVCAPLVINMNGDIEDSARRFPTPRGILKKFFSRKRLPDYAIGQQAVTPDWVGGMFMLFSSDTYKQINGFDERYFLYYEDVDICARLTNLGFHVVLCPVVKVVHLAQRASHKNLKYLRWHITSMLRFFTTSAYWRLL